MKHLVVITLFCVLGSGVWARADVVLQPGDSATVLEIPTKVTCVPSDTLNFVRYCKCTEGGFVSKYTLDLILDDQDDTDQLAVYDSQSQCNQALTTNPACNPK